MAHSFLIIFMTVFLAELGDKTQIAALLFATDEARSPWLVFVAASAALIVATGIAILAGHYAGRYLEAIPLKLISGLVFIAIGGWTVIDHMRTVSG